MSWGSWVNPAVTLPDLSPSPAGTYESPSEIVVDSKGRVTEVTEGAGGGRAAIWDSGLISVGGFGNEAVIPTPPSAGSGFYLVQVFTSVGGRTLTLRTASGGGGDLVAGPFDLSVGGFSFVTDGSSPVSDKIPTHALLSDTGLGVQFRIMRL